MFRKRVGTGELYAENQPRLENSRLRRAGRRMSKMPRGDNQHRPWLSEEPEYIEFDFAAILRQTEQQWSDMLEVFAWIGELVHFCLRRREKLSDESRQDAADWLEWFLVLHTVGLLDRRGNWLGPGLGET